MEDVQEEVLEEEGLDEVSDFDESQDDEPTIEDLAREQGWRSADEYNGENYVPPHEFIRNGAKISESKRDTIRDMAKEMKALKEGVTTVKRHIESSYQAENEKLRQEIENLKSQKIEAIEEGDVERVDEIEKKMDAANRKVSKSSSESSENPDFDEWAQENTWYGKNEEMTAYAESQAKNPSFHGLPPKRFYKAIERQVKTMFPEEFSDKQGSKSNDKKTTPSPVMSGNRQSRNSGGLTKFDLTANQRKVMAEFVAMGHITEKQYIAEIARQRREGV